MPSYLSTRMGDGSWIDHLVMTAARGKKASFCITVNLGPNSQTILGQS